MTWLSKKGKLFSLTKSGNSLSLTVDNRRSVSVKVPKKMHLNKHVWLGGVEEGLRRQLNLVRCKN